MTEQQAIAIIRNTLFTFENTLKYREEKNDEVRIDEYMLPEALRVVLDLATSKNTENIVDSIIADDMEKSK